MSALSLPARGWLATSVRARAWRGLIPPTLIYTILIGPTLAARGPVWFAHLGAGFLSGATSSRAITPSLGAQSPLGYDGQYYFAVAADPAHARAYIAHTHVPPGIVYSRILYPMLARVLGLGGIDGIAYAMLAINLIAVAAGTVALAVWLRRRGVSPAYASLYALFPGLVFCVFRDLTEPLAYGLVAVAVCAHDRRRSLVPGCVLLALAMLTRETTAVFAVGFAVAIGIDRFRRAGRLRDVGPAVLFLAASAAPLLVWRTVVTHWMGQVQEQSHASIGELLPFHAYADWWPWQPMRTIVVATVLAPTVLVAVALLRRRANETLPVVLFALNAIAFVVYLPAPVLVDYGAAGRAAVGVVLSFVLCLPGLLRDNVGRLVAFAWSPLWYLIAFVALGLPAPLPTS